ncbi:hypothetical protein ACLK1T_23820 [Escherichia coli]
MCRSPARRSLTATLSPGAESGSPLDSALVGRVLISPLSASPQKINCLEGHCDGKLQPPSVSYYDLILTMEKRHIERLCEMAPEMRGKVMLFCHLG